MREEEKNIFAIERVLRLWGDYGNFTNTVRDMYAICLKLGIDPNTIAQDVNPWVAYCKNPR